MADDDLEDSASELAGTMDKLSGRTNSMTAGANGFASAMTRAFMQATSGGKKFDDVMKSLVLRMSNMALSQAFRPIAQGLTGGFGQLFSGLFGGGGQLNGNAEVAAALGAIKPFAAGGVIGTPTYFPLTSGGVGLAGEAGPEAILPLSRGADGRLGVASGGGQGGANITVHIVTPDADSFRRSETYITGQIARAVARGQRSL